MRKPKHRMTVDKATKLLATIDWHFDMPNDELVARVRHMPPAVIERIQSAILIVGADEVRRIELTIARARARQTGQDV